MIRILHVIGAMDRAGAETMIMNYYRAIDRNEIQFDFLVHTDRHCDYDDEIEALGGNIYHILRFNGLNYFQYKKACKHFFQAHPEIDIVHGHIESSASIYLPEASKGGKVTIAHSHNMSDSFSFTALLFQIATFRNKHCAEYYMACSKAAGIDRFGSSAISNPNFSILPNAVEVERFTFSETDRSAIREDLHLLNKPTFGHIGRFTKQKNHPFLIDVFSLIKARVPDAQLLLLGKGENESFIQHLVQEKGLSDSVHFLGVRDDIEKILSAIDVFLFPSLWEGLPVALVEVQASGLPSVISETISEEAVMLPTMIRLPLTNPEKWADAAINSLSVDRDILSSQRIITDCGYNIRASAGKLVNTYQRMANQ